MKTKIEMPKVKLNVDLELDLDVMTDLFQLAGSHEGMLSTVISRACDCYLQVGLSDLHFLSNHKYIDHQMSFETNEERLIYRIKKIDEMYCEKVR